MYAPELLGRIWGQIEECGVITMASFFEKIFGKRETQAQAARETFQMLTGYSPTFRTWTGGVFESELIRAALDAHGRHAAKLDPQIDGTAKPNLRSRLHDAPNDWQTWAQFLYRTAVVLYSRNTAFIVPVLGEYEETNGIVTIVPNRWELVTYRNEPYVRFYFANGKKRAIELSKVGILTRYQYKSELFGEDNDALKATLDLIAIQNQGITENVKNSASYRFYGVMGNFATDSDLANERRRFDAENFAKDGGGYGGYRSYGGGGRKKVAIPRGKSMAAATKSAKGTTVKLEPPTPKTKPKVTTKFKKYDI